MSAKNFLKALLSDRTGLAGFLMLSSVILVGFLAPYLNLRDPRGLDYQRFLPPSLEHPFGTDHLGRDIFSRAVWGIRTSLAIGAIAAFISFGIGVVLGAVAGYFGGVVDHVISRITEIFLMIPSFFLILFIIAVYGGSIFNVMAAIGLLIWPSNARITRAQVLSLREREFVQASILAGVSHMKVLFRHIVPNAIFPIIANTMLQIAGAILTETGLSFLGLGDPNVISLGRMIYEGQLYIASRWWEALAPGAVIVIMVFAVHLLGDALSRILTEKRPGGL